jgi:hypothetical protein
MNSLNHQMNFPRVDTFRVYDCNSIADKQTLCNNSYKMTPDQEKLSGKTAFDRGHLTPANPFRFSEEAVRDTFYCVNIAPQDPYTNQGPWSTVEDKAHSYLGNNKCFEGSLNKNVLIGSKAGYVITGLCDLDDRYSPTAEGYIIPACFWKLICYKDDSGSTQVVGFIGNNTLLGANDAKGKEERKLSTTMPQSQQDIMDVMTRDSFINAAWSGAEDYLLRNRNEKSLPTAAACKLKKTLSEAVKNEWSRLMLEV